MYIEGSLPNQDELIKATQKADIKSCYNNGLSPELIAKGFSLSLDEVKEILEEE